MHPEDDRGLKAVPVALGKDNARARRNGHAVSSLRQDWVIALPYCVELAADVVEEPLAAIEAGQDPLGCVPQVPREPPFQVGRTRHISRPSLTGNLYLSSVLLELPSQGPACTIPPCQTWKVSQVPSLPLRA